MQTYNFPLNSAQAGSVSAAIERAGYTVDPNHTYTLHVQIEGRYMTDCDLVHTLQCDQTGIECEHRSEGVYLTDPAYLGERIESALYWLIPLFVEALENQ
jgi:hypothetical protein